MAWFLDEPSADLDGDTEERTEELAAWRHRPLASLDCRPVTADHRLATGHCRSETADWRSPTATGDWWPPGAPLRTGFLNALSADFDDETVVGDAQTA
ncbi:hypothetical protein [Nocardia lijiangensis]|uniref:hypothetical protein n=1 Tax=Nocardia lijiangensis TaxID=299618 RepID=UPI000B1278F8|nr:hypothetical protein [Nocardia lijiangensis]